MSNATGTLPTFFNDARLLPKRDELSRPALYVEVNIVRAKDSACSDSMVLIMGSPHSALGSPGGNWGTGSPVPPMCAGLLSLLRDR